MSKLPAAYPPLTMTTFDSPILSTPRLRLEPLTARHAALMFDGLSDPVCYRYIPQDPPASVESLIVRYRQLESGRSPDGTQAWLNWALIDRDGKAHGYVQATVDMISKVARLAYFFFSRSRREDYAKEALD